MRIKDKKTKKKYSLIKENEDGSVLVKCYDYDLGGSFESSFVLKKGEYRYA